MSTRNTVPYDGTTIREHHIDLSLTNFDIPMDVDTAVIRLHFVREGGRMATKVIRLSAYDLSGVRRA